jgi:hypothetical protein
LAKPTWAHASSSCSLLLAPTTLVTLNLFGHTGQNPKMDYSVVCRVIKTSSRTLRAISICEDVDPCYVSYNYASTDPVQVQALVQAFASCTSLRFLQFGLLMLACMGINDLFALVKHLPIELLSFGRLHSDFTDTEEVSSLRLPPTLLVLMIDELLYRCRIKCESERYVLVEDVESGIMWPPIYEDLSSEAQAIFKDRPYRATSLSSVFDSLQN